MRLPFCVGRMERDKDRLRNSCLGFEWYYTTTARAYRMPNVIALTMSAAMDASSAGRFTLVALFTKLDGVTDRYQKPTYFDLSSFAGHTPRPTFLYTTRILGHLSWQILMSGES